MLGHSHAISGALAFAASAAAAGAVAGYAGLHEVPFHPGAVELILGTLITAGAALLPDIDHPNGTIAHALGPITKHLSKFVSEISGGHRHATHSVLFMLGAGAVTWVGEYFGGKIFTLILAFVMLALGIRALHLSPSGETFRAWGPCVLLAGAGTVVMWRWLPATPNWLPFAIALGCLAHLVGDCLTDRGCPLLWPLKFKLSIPLISRTGNTMETWVLTPLMACGTIALLCLYSDPGNILAH